MPIFFPLLEDWDTRDTTLTPSAKTYNYTVGGQYPLPDVLNLVMPNIGTAHKANYKDFKTYCFSTGLSKAHKSHGNGVIYLAIENIDSISYSGIPIVDPVLTNTYFNYPSINLIDDTYFPFAPVFKNLESLSIGTYYISFTFWIIAKDISTNSDILISTVNYLIDLNVAIDTSITNVFSSPYVNDRGFTLDAKEFTLTSWNRDSYLNIDAKVKVYDFFTNLVNQYIFSQKVVLFKNKEKLEFGSTIHRLMKRFDIEDQGTHQYQWASLQLDIQEKNIGNDSVIRQLSTNEILFVAGLSKGKRDGFLLFNTKPSRVTTLGYYFLNILIPDLLLNEVQVFKNGILFDTIDLPLCQNKTLSLKVSFKDFNKGDVIDYKLVETNNQTIIDEKKVCVFPEGLNSYMIIWEDEFLMKSALECTGEAAIKLNIESIEQKKYKNLVETIETIDSSEEYILSINTGWLMKSDVDAVISLIRSKRAWLITPDKKIELRRSTKSIIAQKTDQELIEFDLEFKINKKNNAETYSL